MSIAPPSDIILDVAQAADPARRQTALAKLAEAAARSGATAGGFETSLAAAPAPAGVRIDASLATNPLWGAGRSQIAAGHGSPYQKFEAVMMQSFVEAMLPKDQDLYGDAASADMCRSLFAQKISEELAKSGRLGVASAIDRYETRTHQTDPAPAAALPAVRKAGHG